MPGNRMVIDPRSVSQSTVPFNTPDDARQPSSDGRASGPLRHGGSGPPGGCDIGSCPLIRHIKGFEALGADISEYNGMLALKGNLRGGIVNFDMVTVGATINVMLAAVRAKGSTVLTNAAKEPHIVDAANFSTPWAPGSRGRH